VGRAPVAGLNSYLNASPESPGVEKELERDLGLYAVLTVSIGAMVGSGIFVLPGLAAKIAGPAVVVAYFLAGLLVMPAVLSKAELATAMPEAGGTYLYIDRAMGPLFGTIAGLGAWFSLVFKSAFALVGLGAYLFVLVPAPVRPVAVALALLLVTLNVVGVKQSGRFQAAAVTVVLLALVAFTADGLTFVDNTRYHPFFSEGPSGLVAAAGFVFVSYAGVTKVASVAEEVEDPGRNLPLGMIGSVTVMMFVYTLVVFVVVGTVPLEELSKTKTPMALAASDLFGGAGAAVLAVVAVLALTSMANAGVLSSSRFPLAMARDDLAPTRLREVHPRFRTPVVAVLATGVLLVVLVATVPVLQLAKLASAFKIIVFAFVNVALIAFREADLDSYDPSFEAPGYPWVQLAGILGGGVLLTQMGAVPLAGAVGIILVGLAWYRVYGRERTEREGAALDAIRRSSTDRALERTRDTFDALSAPRVLLALGDDVSTDAEATMLRVAADLVRETDGRIWAVRFDAVPEQTTLSTAAAEVGPGDVSFADEDAAITEVYDAPVETAEVVTHDPKRSVVNFAAHHDVDVVLGEWVPDLLHPELLGADVDWFIEHGTSDAVFVRERGLDAIENVAVVADSGPYDPLELLVADAVASAADADLQLVYAVDAGAPDEKVEGVHDYHAELTELCSTPVGTRVIRSDDHLGDIERAVDEADLVVVGTAAHHVLYDVLVGALPDRLAERLDVTTLLVHSQQPRRETFLRGVLDWLVH
jgi:amino acid transporter/nucleotide-binding universal stress UspA family protein